MIIVIAITLNRFGFWVEGCSQDGLEDPRYFNEIQFAFIRISWWKHKEYAIHFGVNYRRFA